MEFKTYTSANLRKIEYLKKLPEDEIREIELVARVLPFKTNNYVVDYLIDWEHYRDDPVFILNFPGRRMLNEEHYDRLQHAVRNKTSEKDLQRIIHDIRMQLNPHPAQQVTNIPKIDGIPLKGIQHKYSDIILFFPSQGQTCHAHCTFCFRWPQFVGEPDLQFSMKEIDLVVEYIRRHEEVNEILFTGGDPMVMSPLTIEKYIDALLDAGLPNLKTIRFGSKSLTYWPFTFLPEFSGEAGEMLSVFRKITDRGIHLSFMAHFNHFNELNNEVVEDAISRIRSTGAEIRTQAPVLRNINDNVENWTRMWTRQAEIGMIPYYMFIERETGPYEYFQIPISKVFSLYQDAIRQTGSLAKTVTAPVMSTTMGKVHIMNILKDPESGRKFFMLQFIRHRNREKTYRPFLADHDPRATWFDQLRVHETESVEV